MTLSKAPLGELAKVVSGGTPKRANPEFFDGDIPWVKIGDMLQGTIESTDESITEAGLKGSSAKLLPAGTLLLSIFATIGRTAVLGREAATNQAIAGLLIRDDANVDQRYLRRYLEYTAEGLANQGRGVAQANINLSILRSHEIPLPPIEDQRRIAAVLDAADALRAKRRQAIAQLDSLTQAIFIDMFGDPISNERRWPEFQLSEICTKIQIGPFGSLLHQSDYVEGGVPLVNPMHLIDGQIQPQLNQTVGEDKYAKLEQYQLERGDVVMARRGEMGRVAIVDAKADGYLCGSGSLYLRPDTEQVIPEFLAAALSSPRGRRELENSSLGVTMPNLNSTIVEQFGFGLPAIELQRSFSSALQERSRMHQLQWDQSGALDALFASLQQRAFRGEL